MNKLNKQKILAVVLIIALFAALVGTVSLFYNSIDMFTNTTFRIYNGGKDKYEITSAFNTIQKPYAIISLVAAIVALLGVVAGVASFIVNKPVLKKVSLIISGVTVGAFLVLVITTVCTRYGYSDYKINDLPHLVSNTSTEFVLYSAVMAMLVQQLVYFAVVAAALLINSKIEKKAETEEVEANNITNNTNSENEGE